MSFISADLLDLDMSTTVSAEADTRDAPAIEPSTAEPQDEDNSTNQEEQNHSAINSDQIQGVYLNGRSLVPSVCPTLVMLNYHTSHISRFAKQVCKI